MKVCPNYKNCSFIRVYGNEKQYEDIIQKYCFGKMQQKCKRKSYKMKTGLSPSANILPSGSKIL